MTQIAVSKLREGSINETQVLQLCETEDVCEMYLFHWDMSWSLKSLVKL